MFGLKPFLNPWALLTVAVLVIASGVGGYCHGRNVEEGVQAQQKLDDARRKGEMIKLMQERLDAQDLAIEGLLNRLTALEKAQG